MQKLLNTGQSRPTAAIWLRFATAARGDDEAGFAEQERWCRSRAQEEGINVGYVFNTIASGAVVDYEAMDQLRDLIRSKKIQAVITPNISRLNRNFQNLTTLFTEADLGGVRIITLDDTDTTGRLFRAVMAAQRGAQQPQRGFEHRL